jgi:hypothetical protein
MKLIPLTQGQYAMVDDEDYDYLIQWKWYAQYDKGKYYATRGYFDTRINNNSKIRMHNAIMNPPKNILTDHIDLNPLNNQRSNLRYAQKYENARNKSSKKNSTSKYLGVHWSTKEKRWCSQIRVNNKTKNLGRYKNEINAAKAYDTAAKIYFGEFANLNFKLKKHPVTDAFITNL